MLMQKVLVYAVAEILWARALFDSVEYFRRFVHAHSALMDKVLQKVIVREM